MHRHLFSLMLALGGSAGALAAHGSTPDAPAALLECAIPLAAARQHLEARGYVVTPEATDAGFATAYQVNQQDSERRLFGSLAVERARRYQVNATTAGVRFAVYRRETVIAAEVLGRRHDETREFVIAPSETTREVLRQMRQEVCDPLADPPSPARRIDPAIESYLSERCRSGDERACGLLRRP